MTTLDDPASNVSSDAAPPGLVRNRSPVAYRTLALWGVPIGVIALAALFAPLLAPAAPDATNFSQRFAAPSLHHLFGTDELGRDEFTRILYGTRISLGLTLLAAVSASVIGLVVGLVAGFVGGVVDQVLMRIVDALLALPGFILALAVAGLLGPGLIHLVLAVIAVWWTGYARVVRSMVLSIRQRPYVDAARATGSSGTRIIIRHVLPNVAGPSVVLVMLEMAHILLALAALSFLGLGVPQPTPEWGAMIADARAYLDQAPQLLAYPGAAITLVALLCNLAGDGLRDALDPRVQRHVLS
ncbi:MAG TPA: ABC transporter permease subunit [Acidimicrobiales bacterium]|nr:ABC transporter permease subunit [Acidimicrobiales bacterium]